MSLDYMMEKWGGGEVLKRAVRGMLPKNRLRDKRLARLKVFEGTEHPYKQNIVRFSGKPYQPGQVMEAIEAQQAESISSPPSS